MNRQKERIALRCQIVEMRHNGHSLRKIAAILGISKTTVRFWLRRWENDRNLSSLHKGGRARKTTPEQDQQILEAADNPLSTAASIAETLQLNVTPRTVRRRLRASRAPERTLMKQQELPEQLLQMRARFANQHIQEDVAFWERTVFTGEETFSSAGRTTLAQRLKVPGANQRLSNQTRTMILNIHGYFRSQDTETSETNLMLKSADVTGVCMRTIQNIKKHAKGRNSTLPQKLEDIWSVQQLPSRARTVILNLQKYLRSQDVTMSKTDLLLKTAAITGVSVRIIQDVEKQSKEDAGEDVIDVEETEFLSESESKEEDVEMAETILPAVKEKSSHLEGPTASEVKQDWDNRESVGIKEEPFGVKTEPPDIELMDEEQQCKAVSLAPEAKKSRIDFEKVWVKVEQDLDESLNECEDKKSSPGFEEVYIKSEYVNNENLDTHEDYEITRQEVSQDGGTESVHQQHGAVSLPFQGISKRHFEEPRPEKHSTQSVQPAPDPLLIQPTPDSLSDKSSSKVPWTQPTPQPLSAQHTLMMHSTQPRPQLVSIQHTPQPCLVQSTLRVDSSQPSLRVLSTQPTPQPLLFQPTLVVHSAQPTPQSLSVQPTLRILPTQPTPQSFLVQTTPQPLSAQPTFKVLSNQPAAMPSLTQPTCVQVVNVLPVATPLNHDITTPLSHTSGHSNAITQVKPQIANVESPLPPKQSSTKSPKSSQNIKFSRITEASSKFETVVVRKEKGYQELRTNVTTDEQASKWLLEYSRENHVSFSVSSVYKGVGRYISLHRKLVCSHRNKHKGMRKTYSGCKVTMILKILPLRKRRTRRDEFRMKYPCKIVITGEHNHLLESTKSLAELRLLPDTKEQFYRYFDVGMTAGQASRLHSEKQRFATSFHTRRGINPTPKVVAHIRAKWLSKHCSGTSKVFQRCQGRENKEKSCRDMFAAIQNYAEKNQDSKVKVLLEEGSFCIVLLTPFMMRVHRELKESSEVVFVDTVRHVKELSTAVTLLLCVGPTGAAPLGVIMSSSQDKTIYKQGFQMLKQILGETAFYGQGHPNCFMTDDNIAERTALKEVWPESRQYLSVFHILQQVCTWLWHEDHSIRLDKQPDVVKLVKDLVYAQSQENFDNTWSDFQQSSLALYSADYIRYLARLVERQHEWCIMHQEGRILKDYQTDSYAAATAYIIKDIILNKCKNFNTGQLLLYMNEVFDAFMKQQMLNLALGRVHAKLPNLKIFQEVMEANTEETGHRMYKVRSKTDDQFYNVDMSGSFCNCIFGKSGKVCDHQLSCAEKVLLELQQTFKSTPERRQWLASVALGKDKTPALDYFSDMKKNPTVSPGTLPELKNNSQNTKEKPVSLVETVLSK